MKNEEMVEIHNLEDFKNYEEAYKEFLENNDIDYIYRDNNKLKSEMDFEEILDLLADHIDDDTEEIDYNFVTTYGIIESDNFRFEIGSSQYRKDGGLCNSEIDDFFTITDLRIERENEKKKKLAKKEKANKQKEVDKTKWITLFESKTKEELLELLINTKYTLK